MTKPLPPFSSLQVSRPSRATKKTNPNHYLHLKNAPFWTAGTAKSPLSINVIESYPINSVYKTKLLPSVVALLLEILTLSLPVHSEQQTVTWGHPGCGLCPNICCLHAWPYEGLKGNCLEETLPLPDRSSQVQAFLEFSQYQPASFPQQKPLTLRSNFTALLNLQSEFLLTSQGTWTEIGNVNTWLVWT